MARLFSLLTEKFPEKGLIVAVRGHGKIAAARSRTLEGLGVPCSRSTSSALRALARAADWCRWRENRA